MIRTSEKDGRELKILWIWAKVNAWLSVDNLLSGYDANDDFIDDSEAHDVHVPQEYETWHGGFYVNQGKLRFKMGADSAEDVNLITGTKKRNLGLRNGLKFFR